MYSGKRDTVLGDAWNNTLTAQDKINIEDYIQLNGKIWLIGSDIFYLDEHDPEIGDFAYDVLGIDFIVEDNGSCDLIRSGSL